MFPGFIMALIVMADDHAVVRIGLGKSPWSADTDTKEAASLRPLCFEIERGVWFFGETTTRSERLPRPEWPRNSVSAFA